MYFYPKHPTYSETFLVDRAQYALAYAIFCSHGDSGAEWGNDVRIMYGDVVHTFRLSEEGEGS
jgi:hypothetical protein